MINETFSRHGLRFLQINKRTARKYFNKGNTIYLQSSNMSFFSVWQSPCPINKLRDSSIGRTFEAHCNDYMYYNCDSERGRYIHFFIQIP